MANAFVDKQSHTHPRLTERLWYALEQFPEHEQDRLAEFLLGLLANDEALWDAAFAQSGGKLQKLRDEALKAHQTGETRLLDPEKL
jgi:hypothetical protein